MIAKDRTNWISRRRRIVLPKTFSICNIAEFVSALTLIVSLGTLFLIASNCDAAGQANDASQIDQWVQQLGSPHFVQRQEAKRRLLQQGVAAFEALHAAQYHDDVEIRSQAQYLLRSIEIPWRQEDDASAVQKLLDDYHELGPAQRLQFIRKLGDMGRDEWTLQGPKSDTSSTEPAAQEILAALCRIVRFESSEILSKYAAMMALRLPRYETPQFDSDAFAVMVRRQLEPSQRVAAQWLMTHVRGLAAPEAVFEDWRKFGRAEVKLAQRQPQLNRLGVARDFLRWRVRELQRLAEQPGLQQSALREIDAVVKEQLFPIQESDYAGLLDSIDWMIENRVWPATKLLVDEHPELFQSEPQLRYRWAEALQRQGQPDEAEKIVAEILGIDDAANPDLHTRLGIDQQIRGNPEWAEREYQVVLKTHDPESFTWIRCADLLGSLCHDYGWHEKAHQAYARLVKRMEKDTKFVQLLQQSNIKPMELRSKMHFSHGLQLGEAEKFDEQRQALEKAARFDREEEPNADIVIAMYRVPNSDAAWRKKTQGLIDKMRSGFELKIQAAELNARNHPSERSAKELAMQLNQFAWLVSNTEGDQQKALEASRRSVELIGEDAGYLDTLARCHFALGDLERAVKTQRRAVERMGKFEPASGQILRQFEFFQAEFSKKTGTPMSSEAVESDSNANTASKASRVSNANPGANSDAAVGPSASEASPALPIKRSGIDP